ncbi:MAG: cadmium-translocating P-type ATPase [Gammaproteobacteria bacterium]|nr:cadmium-translocating P-type ATPase [Gammaproteobacteria bacterium]
MTSKASVCYHCGLDLPPQLAYNVMINAILRPMCCPGCQAVAQAIVDNRLTDYYRYRTAPAATAGEPVPDLLKQMTAYDHPKLQQQFVATSTADNHKHTSLILEGIVCAACVWLNEKHVNGLPGVVEFRVNFSNHRASLIWDTTRIKLSEILQAIALIGYRAHPVDAQRQAQIQQRERGRALRRLAVAGLGSMQIMMLAVALYAGAFSGIDTALVGFFRWVSLLLATPVVLYSAWPFYQSAWRDLRLARVGMDVPVAVSILAGYLASVYATLTQQHDIYFDSISMFIFFLLGGRYLEMQARHRAGEVAANLVKLIPAMSTRIDAAGQEQVIAVSELSPGDKVRVKPGETIPADGIVDAGQSHVDEALLTGESIPLYKQAGDPVIGGSVNVDSPLQLRIEKVGADTVLAGIQRLLDRAQTEKPAIVLLADQVARYFVLGLFVIALLVGLWWWQHQPSRALWIVISVLVVSCPCALSLATPVALITATGRLMQLGMLTTRGHALQTLAGITHVVFDKTGTLTYGRAHITSIELCSSLPREQVLAIAAALERGSEHPLAQAFTTAAVPRLNSSDYRAFAGQGMQATVEGKIYRIGRADFVRPVQPMVRPAQPSHHTTLWLADSEQMLAVFYLEDELRPDALSTVRELQHQGLQVCLFSGDQPAVVARFAERLGIRQWQAGLLPQDKLAQLRGLQAQGAVVAMVGDGVNDAPVLAAAQVSIAMGSGTPLAQGSADLVLLSERLAPVAQAVDLARRSRRVIQQNLAWAILYNIVAIPLAGLGYIVPWMAGIGMSASSLLVVLNALGLQQFAQPRTMP